MPNDYYYFSSSDSYISVSSPQDGHQSYQVRSDNDTICAFGTAIDGEGYPATEVQVANYTYNPSDSEIAYPSGSSIEVNGCGQWEATNITGVNHSSSGYGESNWLVVWAHFSSGWTVQVVEYLGTSSSGTACQLMTTAAYSIARGIDLLNCMPNCDVPIVAPDGHRTLISNAEVHPDDQKTKDLIVALFGCNLQLSFLRNEFNSAIFTGQNEPGTLDLKYTISFVPRKAPIGLLLAIPTPAADNPLAGAKPVRFAPNGNGSIELVDPAADDSAPKKSAHYFRSPRLHDIVDANGNVSSSPLAEVLKKQVHLLVGK